MPHIGKVAVIPGIVENDSTLEFGFPQIERKSQDTQRKLLFCGKLQAIQIDFFYGHFVNNGFPPHLRKQAIIDKIGSFKKKVVGCNDTARKRTDRAG